MSNAISGKESDNTSISTNTETSDLGEEDPIEPTTEEENNPEPTTENNDNMRSIKEEVIVPEVIKEETESNLVPIVADMSDSDIATNTKKKKSTLSKVGKSLASIIASI